MATKQLPASLKVKLLVKADGTAGDVSFADDELAPEDAAAIRTAVAACRWTPGADGTGTARAMWAVLPLRFDAENARAPQAMRVHAVGPFSMTGASGQPAAWDAPEGRGFRSRVVQAVAAEWQFAGLLRSAKAKPVPDTVLSVSIDRGGQLREVRLVKSSGIETVDAAAMEAFRQAEPFASPPPSLMDGRWMTTFTLAFHYELMLRR
jgi:TonB family protein